jgi:radical SAM superfamily enzyme YgiQ (UPF0313 family)
VNVILLSMPDSFEHMAPVAIRMPNGALTSLAGNVDAHHTVAVADLILVQDRVAETVERLVREREPDVVGLSVMTFQRRTAFKIIALVRALRPSARIVVGGYDPSLAPDAWAASEPPVDFIVRGAAARARGRRRMGADPRLELAHRLRPLPRELRPSRPRPARGIAAAP